MDKKKLILIIQSVLCVLLTVMLSAAAVGIYSDGVAYKAEHPEAWVYTREKAADALLKNSPVFILSVIVTAAAAVMGIKSESKPVKDARIVRDLALSRISEPTDEMKKERTKQKRLHIGGWIAYGLCMVPILIYILNGANFDRSDASGLEAVMGALMLHIVPWIIIGTGCLSVSFILCDKGMEKETALAKNCTKAEPAAAAAPKMLTVNIARGIVLVVSVSFIILGINNGSMNDVLIKAIQICTECVGLG